MRQYATLAFLLLELLASPAWAATHTVRYKSEAGRTLRAYPDNQALSSWATYAITPTYSEGVYTFTVDDANGVDYGIYEGSGQPASKNDAEASFSVAIEATLADIAESVGNASFIAVDPDVIDDSRTWTGNGARAQNIITVADNFIGTFALKPDLNNSIISPAGGSVTATITGAATVTPASYAVNRDYTKAHITVPQLTTTGTYTVVIKTVTVDGQTIYTTCTLKVQ